MGGGLYVALLVAVYRPPPLSLWGPWEPTQWVCTIFGTSSGHLHQSLVGAMGTMGQGPRPMAPLCWGVEIHSREASLGSISVYIPPSSLEHVPPRMAPILGVLVGTSQESWENSILDIRVLFTWLLLTRVHVFFPDDVLQRNWFIKRVELFELSPILLLSRCLEACQ